MSDFTDAEYLKAQQYKDSGNYGVRVRFHERFSTNPQDMHRWVFEQMLAGIPAEARLLELGGGRADLWIKSFATIPAGWEIVFSDFSAGMVEDAQGLLDEKATRFAEFRVIDAQFIPYEDVTFDAVIANMMLYHVPDRATALREIYRVLKPGGKLYAMTLGEHHMRELYEWVREVVPELGFSLKHTENPFSLENGVAQLEAVFDDVSVMRYEDSIAVTEVPSLVQYIASLQDHVELLQDNDLSQQFKAAAQQAITDHTAIRSTKEVGLLIGSKGL